MLTETQETMDLPFPREKMHELVFGRQPARDGWLRARLGMLLLGLGLAAAGCATGRAAHVDNDAVVGLLIPSAHSVASAPVHRTTDLAPAAFVAGDTADDDAGGMTVTEEQAPDVVAKSGGLMMGSAR